MFDHFPTLRKKGLKENYSNFNFLLLCLSLFSLEVVGQELEENGCRKKSEDQLNVVYLRKTEIITSNSAADIGSLTSN